MSLDQIAERYGRAIFELGLETGELLTLTQQLSQVAQAYGQSAELRAVMNDPVASDQEQKQLIDNLAARIGLSGNAKNAVLLLAQRRRLAALPEIAARLASLADERNGVLRVTFTSAEPLSEAYSADLVKQLEQTLGKRVVVEKRVDPSLIAGVVTTIGDNTIDGSLSGRLRQVEQQLLEVV